MEWEKRFADDISDKGLVCKIYKGLTKLHTRKTNEDSEEMGRRHEETLFQRRHPDGQQTNKKMLNVTHHQGNTTTLRYYLTLVRVAKMNKSGDCRC